MAEVSTMKGGKSPPCGCKPCSPVVRRWQEGGYFQGGIAGFTQHVAQVTRVEPFKPANKEQVEARTIYVENLPSDADHDSLTKVGFCTFFLFGEGISVTFSCILYPLYDTF